MILTVIGKKQIKSFSLPQKVKGQYWLYEELDGKTERLVSVEGVDGEWVIKSNHGVKLLDSQNTDIKDAVVYPFGFYALKKKNEEKVFVFAEPISADRQVFTKYLIKSDVDLSIGRSEQNDICFANKGISHQHAVLSFKNGGWSVTDIDSTNGTFVNGMRVQKEMLNIGDVIFIMGLKIIIGKQFIALNSPDGNVSVSGKLIKFVKQKEIPQDEKDDNNAPEMERFYRSPRFKREVETAVFRIDSPPTSPVADEMPWMLVMGSSMTMGMMSLVTLGSAIASSNTTSMLTGGAMLLGTLLLPIITRTYERKRKHKKEEQRQIKYREYLNKVSVEINETCQQQEEILNENSATVQECEQRILERQRNLWEREAGQNDFLVVRVGSGYGALNAEFQCAERKFTIDEDNLEEELFTLCERDKSLHNVPVTYSLKDNRVSGVIGQRKFVVEFAKGLIIQLAALHSYDEVKMVFIYDKNECDLDFVKWLPHVWSNDGAFRFIATDSDEVKELSAYLEKIVDDREQMNKSDLEEVSPYYVIFSMSKALSSQSEVLKKVLASKDDLHISIVTLYDELSSLPKECSMIVEIGKNGGRLYDKDALVAKNADFKIDIYPSVEPRKLSVALANITLDTETNNLKMPDMITFMELFGVGKVEHLNVLTRWKENDPTKSLKTAVGIGTDGNVFMLDLHEKFQGPHGLIAGMTGSGKSEFIITYILSLAVNYHPDEVAFILIDYKGGGMAKSFENLPHTAGIITNLDGAAIKRSLISIESELKRRQAIFAEASKKIGVSNIDIYKYQKLYREGTVREPLPHLFIIADEFAELKTQQPEFMTQLISAARIGRSLGIHLILATQKPSGVVDDQIWSNSRFRVCLKV